MKNLQPSDRHSSLFSKLIIALLISTSVPIFGQVGINTTNPTATLDVNGTIRIRQLEDAPGSHVLSINEEGKVSKFKTYLLYDGDEVVAHGPVQELLAGSETINDIDLGLKIAVFIPRDIDAKVIVNYSVPMGTSLENNPEKTYIGLTFLKDGIEMPQGSRKFTLPPLELQSGNNISSMGTITNTYIENFEASPYDREFIFEVKGYVEQHSNSQEQISYKFNMWNNGTNNYNWGKASISFQTYVK